MLPEMPSVCMLNHSQCQKLRDIKCRNTRRGEAKENANCGTTRMMMMMTTTTAMMMMTCFVFASSDNSHRCEGA